MTAAQQSPKMLAVQAAMDVAEAVAGGTLNASALEAAAVQECRQLFGHVAGPGDPLWELHIEVARQVLGVGGGIPAGELAEWLAVTRSAEGGDAPRGPQLADDAEDAS